MQQKWIALNHEGFPHHTEHLAPIAKLFEMPLIVTDEDAAALFRHYYPGLQVEVIPRSELTTDFLKEHCSLIATSHDPDREKFHALFGEEMTQLFVPHGFSDKAYWMTQSALSDICLLYGEQMLTLIQNSPLASSLQKTVRMGNLRYHDYLQNKEVYDQITKKELPLDPSKKTLLYAPTWTWNEEHSRTSFFDAAEILLKNLPSDCQLIVKLHPHLKLNNIAHVERIIALYEEEENIHFLEEFPLIYPLLDLTDIYIGDLSSIGYDFLVYDRPLFFLNHQRRDPEKDPDVFLFRAGRSLLPEEFSKIYQLIGEEEDPSLSQKRKELYKFTFDEIDPEEVKKEILAAVQKS